MLHRWKSLPITSILFIAAILRLHNISRESLWVDEAYSVRVSQLPLAEIIYEATQDTHPPLYHILLHYWLIPFSVTEMSVRLFSVLCSIGIVYMIYKIGKLIFNRKIGLIAGIITAVNTFQIYYAQEARMYSLLGFLGLMSVYFFARIVKHKHSLKYQIGYVLSTTLLLYTHFHGWFLFLVQAVFVLISFVPNLKKFNLVDNKPLLIIQIIVLVLYIPWSIIIWGQYSLHSESWIPRPTLYSFPSGFREFSGSAQLAVLFTLLSLWAFFRKTQIVFAIFISIGILLITPFIISHTVLSIFKPKFLIIVSLLWFLIIAFGYTQIKDKFFKLLIIVIFLISTFFSLNTYYISTKKEQWRELAEYINFNVRQKDLIIVHAGYCLDNGLKYYLNRKDIPMIPFPAETVTKNVDVTHEHFFELRKVLSMSNRVWYVHCHPSDPLNLIETNLSGMFGQTQVFKFQGLELRLFESKKNTEVLTPVP